MEDVAQRARVSRATASRALTGAPKVSSQARARIDRAVSELGYVPHSAARDLAVGRRDHTIAVVAVASERQFAEDPYCGRLMAGVVSAAQQTGLRVSVQLTDEEGVAKVPALRAPASFAGTLLVGVPRTVAEQLEFPDPQHTVSIGRSVDSIVSADPDNEAGTQSAIAHLMAGGRSRIGMVAGPVDNSCIQERIAAYRAAMAEAERPAYVADAGFAPDDAATAAASLLADHPDLDGLFVATDLMAAGVLQALAAGGHRVPEDVAVVGFDDSIVARCTAPTLTSVAQPVERIAEWATLTSVSGEHPAGDRVVFPTSLVVRGSSRHQVAVT